MESITTTIGVLEETLTYPGSGWKNKLGLVRLTMILRGKELPENRDSHPKMMIRQNNSTSDLSREQSYMGRGLHSHSTSAYIIYLTAY